MSQQSYKSSGHAKIITSGQILVFDRIGLPDMIGASASLVAKNGTKKSSQLFEEVLGSNSELKLITSKPITMTYFDTNLNRFGLVCLPMMAIFNF